MRDVAYLTAEEVVARRGGNRLDLVVEFAEIDFNVGSYERIELPDEGVTWWNIDHGYKVTGDRKVFLEEIWQSLLE